ncbi:MAG: VOC family protein [Oceanospirillaceae bacterium]|nr:VOC family protein [Oceanospirillaceae bacterium]
MLDGINHVTIAVSDLKRSVDFYQHKLLMKLEVVWANGAYLSVAGQWVCLSVDEVCVNQDYSHLAFGIAKDDFSVFSKRLLAAGVIQWKKNKSEGDSLYILDPDGYKLEIHVGDLSSRLSKMLANPSADMIFY